MCKLMMISTLQYRILRHEYRLNDRTCAPNSTTTTLADPAERDYGEPDVQSVHSHVTPAFRCLRLAARHRGRLRHSPQKNGPGAAYSCRARHKEPPGA